MMKNLKLDLGFALAAVLLMLMPSSVKAGDSSPILGGGNFGLGLELGDPGAWGASGKIWVNHDMAFQPAIKLGEGNTLLQLDYLFHDYGIAHPQHGLMPLYLGFGGDLSLQGTVTIGARGVAGISYMFDQANVPVDIFIQIAPTLWFYTSGTQFDVYGELGAHYYF
jgi:hypothetical protein